MVANPAPLMMSPKNIAEVHRSFHPRLPLPYFRTGSLVREPRNRLGLVESTTI